MNLGITVTGADDRVIKSDLVAFARENPEVEIALLFSVSRAGTARYPSWEWMSYFFRVMRDAELTDRIAIHLCGDVVKAVMRGCWDWTRYLPHGIPHFDRVQLNCGDRFHELSDAAIEGMYDFQERFGSAIVFGVHDGWDHLASSAFGLGLDVCCLYDSSGGLGEVPIAWPLALADVPSGWAGGLTPDNVADHLPHIATAARGESFWIDAESGVRDKHDRFSLERAAAFVRAAKEAMETTVNR